MQRAVDTDLPVILNILLQRTINNIAWVNRGVQQSCKGATNTVQYLDEQCSADCSLCVQVQRFDDRLHVCARTYILQSQKFEVLTTATNISQVADLAFCKSVSHVLSLDDAVAFSIKSLVDLCSLSFCFLRCRYQRTAYPGTISIVTEVICGHVCGAMSDRSCSTKRYIESPEISATCIHLGCIREAGTL